MLGEEVSRMDEIRAGIRDIDARQPDGPVYPQAPIPGEVLGEGPGGMHLSDLELETLWPTVPEDAKPGDEGLINELSVPQRLALPAAFHRPVYDDLGTPHLWHCAVCWGDGWSTQWPCEPATKDGTAVVLDPKGVAEARGTFAAADAELHRLAEWVLANCPGEPSQEGGVVDTVIRLIGSARADGAAEAEEERADLERQNVELGKTIDAEQRKLRAIQQVHVWTNEDGRQFLFADDVRGALGIPS